LKKARIFPRFFASSVGKSIVFRFSKAQATVKQKKV